MSLTRNPRLHTMYFLPVFGIKNSVTDVEDIPDFLKVLLMTASTTSDKMFGTKYRNLVKLDKNRKRSHLSCQSLISGKETGHKARSPAKFVIFLIFSNFLISPKSLNCLATSETTRIPSLLYWISSFVLLVANRTCTETL